MRLDKIFPQPSPGEVACAIILSQLTLLAILAPVYLKLRRRKVVPSHIVAAFEAAFLPEEAPCQK